MGQITLSGLALVGAGGAAGAMARFGVAMAMSGAQRPPTLWVTWLVNVAGCVLAGLLVGLADPETGVSERWRWLLIVGFCGGLTTFSAFGLETFDLLRQGKFTSAGVYVGGSVVCGVAGLAVGWFAARALRGA